MACHPFHSRSRRPFAPETEWEYNRRLGFESAPTHPLINGGLMKVRSRVRPSAALVTPLALGIPPAFAQQEISGSANTTTARAMDKAISPVSQDMLDRAAQDAKNWIHPNGSYDQQRFYPGDQVNTSNVKGLRPAFVFQTAVLESMET